MKYWALKTFMVWAPLFDRQKFVGIDEPGAVNKDYQAISKEDIAKLIASKKLSPVISRYFDLFTSDVKIGDHIIVGVGSTTEFKVKFIGQITSGYRFDPVKKEQGGPRHVRDVSIIEYFNKPIPYPALGRSARIECLTEQDFDRVMAHVAKSKNP